MRLRRTTIFVALVALLALPGATVPAAPNPTVRATLTGYEETPQTLSSPATGEFRAKIGDRIEFELSYAGLPTAVLAAHIHLGARATTGGVAAFLCGGGGKPPCPQGGGMVTGTIVASDVIGPAGQGIAAGEFGELVQAILAGATYVNVHTAAFPGGEIRGQIDTGRRRGRN